MNRIALITGATAGIGKATAKLLAGNNFDLILTGRRKEKLDALKTEIESGTASNALTLCFDVRDSGEVDTAIGLIPSKWQNIDILINNAGLSAGLNPIQDGVIDDWERMIDTNIKGLLYITRRVSPLMIGK
ncbi:MAG: SDR family NAD(P)-dependent oxidoreductase, partial [Chlorobi bacterium]|nr:SDR family NAD(P)-dependent oxidoreductase [Chlorobiota bacterium]